MCEEYQGWANHATWAVHLWFANDQALYTTTRELVATPTKHHYEKEQILRDFVEELCGEPLQAASIASDLLGHTLSQVDWRAVVEAFEDE